MLGANPRGRFWRCAVLQLCDQARTGAVLAIRMLRSGFEEALSMASLSHLDPVVFVDRETWPQRKAVNPVRVQWDPERDVGLEALGWRSLQVGLGGVAAERYVDEWLVCGQAKGVRPESRS